MGRVADMIRYLIDPSDPDSKDHQDEFFKAPLKVCKAYKLIPAEISIVFDMDPTSIAKLTAIEGDDLTNMINAYLPAMGNKWPDRGDYTLDPFVNANACKDHKRSMGDLRIFWSAPRPHIDHLFRTAAHLGDSFDLKLAGEGFLENAKVELIHGGSGFTISAVATGYHCCNFRRTYLLARVAIPGGAPTEGEYNAFVTNPGSIHRREGGQPFLVSP